jgi:hypothetical protein
VNLVANHFMDGCIQTKESSDNVEGRVEEYGEEQSNEIDMALYDMFHGLYLVEEHEI